MAKTGVAVDRQIVTLLVRFLYECAIDRRRVRVRACVHVCEAFCLHFGLHVSACVQTSMWVRPQDPEKGVGAD